MGRVRLAVIFVAVLVALLAGTVGRAHSQTSSAALVLSAEAKMKAGDAEGALADLAQAIALDPSNADAFGNRGLLRQHAQDLDGAIADFTQAIALNPRHAVGYMSRMRARLARGELDGAIADAYQVVALLPESVGAFEAQETIMLAQWDRAYKQTTASEREKIDAALKGIEATNALLAWRPDFVDALVYKGLFLRVRAGLEADPAAQKLLLSQADTLQARAKELMNAASASAPVAIAAPAATAAVHIRNAEQKWEALDFDGAIDELTKAIALEGQNGQAFFLRGFIHLAGGHLDQSIADLTEVTVINPQHAPSYAFRSAARFRNRDGGGAITDARIAIKLDPTLRLAHRVLLAAYWDDASPASTASLQRRRDAAAAGSAAADLALEALTDKAEPLIFKSLFLRVLAEFETDVVKQTGLVGQATALRTLADDRIEDGDEGPIRVGAEIEGPKKVVDVPVAYPDIARQARVQGLVIVEVVVDGRGRVAEAKVIKSIPLLDQAAIAAVRQWVYQPTNVDGMPALVTFNVTANFTLK